MVAEFLLLIVIVIYLWQDLLNKDHSYIEKYIELPFSNHLHIEKDLNGEQKIILITSITFLELYIFFLIIWGLECLRIQCKTHNVDRRDMVRKINMDSNMIEKSQDQVNVIDSFKKEVVSIDETNKDGDGKFTQVKVIKDHSAKSDNDVIIPPIKLHDSNVSNYTKYAKSHMPNQNQEEEIAKDKFWEIEEIKESDESLEDGNDSYGYRKSKKLDVPNIDADELVENVIEFNHSKFIPREP